MDDLSPVQVPRRSSIGWGFCLLRNDLHSTVLRFLAAGARCCPFRRQRGPFWFVRKCPVTGKSRMAEVCREIADE